MNNRRVHVNKIGRKVKARRQVTMRGAVHDSSGPITEQKALVQKAMQC